ncbi:hypothetical protein Droror1_Dr00012655 [Drosera rotundifolia]
MLQFVARIQKPHTFAFNLPGQSHQVNRSTHQNNQSKQQFQHVKQTPLTHPKLPFLHTKPHTRLPLQSTTQMVSFLQATITAVDTLLLVSLLFLLLLLILLRHRSHHTIPSPSPILADSMAESASFDPIPVSMQELIRATNNFEPSFVIGDDSFGLVYRAELVSSASYSVSVVALKKLDPNALQGQREFRVEMENLGKLRHRNLAWIFGYCVSQVRIVC